MNCDMISEVLHLVSTQPIAEDGLKSIALSEFNGLEKPVAEEIIENLVKICPHVKHITISKMCSYPEFEPVRLQFVQMLAVLIE